MGLNEGLVMDMSETVVAAMIGASATIATAMFQIFSGARAKVDSRGNTSRGLFRTTLAIAALMIASGVGGFIYAELRADNTRRDLKQMRDEFSAQLKAVASSTARLESMQSQRTQVMSGPTLQLASSISATKEIESVVHVPACRLVPGSTEDLIHFTANPPPCDESTAQRLSLCAAIPSNAIIQDVQLFSRAEEGSSDWSSHRVGFDQNSDSARFVDKPYEQVMGADYKALCVNYAHFNSERAHLARLVVQIRPQ
jgi:hypothetical protein